MSNLLRERVAGLLIRRSRRVYSMAEKTLYGSGLLSREKLILPDFLGIGAQKAGTNWLYVNLRCHDELYLPDEGELHFFDWGYDSSLRSYSEKFRPGLEKTKGEITPAYGAIPSERIRFIRRIMPDVRLIFLMRNPIDRAWAAALMNLVSRKKRTYEDVKESEFFAHFTSAGSVMRGDYLTTLDNWLGVFPRKRLLIGLFEDIANRPRELLKAIFAHLGISIDVNWDAFPYGEVIHKGAGVPLPDKYRDFLREMYCKEIEKLYERLGDPVAAWRCS